MPGEELRVALVLDRPEAPAPWQLRLLERICAHPRLTLSALLQPAANQAAGGGSVLHGAWNRFEEAVAARPEPAKAPRFLSVRDKLSIIQTEQEKAVAALSLDVIVDLTGNYGRTCSARLARHGTWFFDHLTPVAGTAGLCGTIGSEPTSQIALFRRVADRAEPVSIAGAALNTKFIAARNELFMKEKSVTLLLRELERVQALGLVEQIDEQDFVPHAAPDVSDLATYARRLVRKLSDQVLRRAVQPFGLGRDEFYLISDVSEFSKFDPATSPRHIACRNEFYADPFLWDREGEVYCFFEVFDHSAKRGHISVGRFEGDRLVDIEVALRTPYHLSFPFLFEDEGTLYMMPETSSVRRVEIWKCDRFPDQWSLHSIGLEGVLASDSTLTKIDDQWWLFSNISTDPFQEMNSELHVFQVDGPDLKSVTPHAHNPVVFDSRTARNAGRIRQWEGATYRPSQNNSHGLYGYGINIMQIEKLSLCEYREKRVFQMTPDFAKDAIGCHHIDMRAGRIVIDVRKGLGGFGRSQRSRQRTRVVAV